jgi:hypothetical protein
VHGRKVLSKTTNFEKIVTAREFGVPQIIVSSTVLMQSLFRTAMMDVVMLIAHETERSNLPFSLTVSLVDGAADVYPADRADFACSQAEKGICGRERSRTYSGDSKVGIHDGSCCFQCLLMLR